MLGPFRLKPGTRQASPLPPRAYLLVFCAVAPCVYCPDVFFGDDPVPTLYPGVVVESGFELLPSPNCADPVPTLYPGVRVEIGFILLPSPNDAELVPTVYPGVVVGIGFVLLPSPRCADAVPVLYPGVIVEIAGELLPSPICGVDCAIAMPVPNAIAIANAPATLNAFMVPFSFLYPSARSNPPRGAGRTWPPYPHQPANLIAAT